MVDKSIIFLAIFYLFSCSAIEQIKLDNKFITVKNMQLFDGNNPYYFVGTNFWYGCYLGSPGKTGDRERLKLELDMLKSLNIDNLRILAASEESTIKKSLTPAVQKELGIYNTNLLEGLDFLLYEMSKRDMRAVIFLNNYWEWSGGMGQYNAWTLGGEAVDPDDFSKNWEEFNIYVSSFYRNKEANDYFRKFIKEVVTRKNKFTGQFYFEDPTIMSWQLANEPRPGNGEDGKEYIEYYYKWIDETAEYIHSIDPNHMVSSGNEGVMGSLGSAEYYLTAHKSTNIDYLTFHLWAKNWGWFDATRIEETYTLAENNAIDYFNQHMELARKLNKPIILEEFGLPRDNENTLINSATSARDKYFTTLFNLISDSAKAGAPIAGTNFWTWGGYGIKKHEDSIWREGDPFTGDPPQEPQGLNSVFSTDSITLDIIRRHGTKMKSLRDR